MKPERLGKIWLGRFTKSPFKSGFFNFFVPPENSQLRRKKRKEKKRKKIRKKKEKNLKKEKKTWKSEKEVEIINSKSQLRLLISQHWGAIFNCDSKRSDKTEKKILELWFVNCDFVHLPNLSHLELFVLVLVLVCLSKRQDKTSCVCFCFCFCFCFPLGSNPKMSWE